MDENMKYLQRELRRVSGGLLRVDEALVEPCIVADLGIEPQWQGSSDVDLRLPEYHVWKFVGEVLDINRCLFALPNLPNWKGQPMSLLEVVAVLFASGGAGRKEN